MKRRGSHTEYDKYAEDIVPERVTVERRAGNFVVYVPLDGFRGVDTGEVYFSWDEKKRMDSIIREMVDKYGRSMLTFNFPYIVFAGGGFETRRVVGALDYQDIESTGEVQREYATAST
jgi:hypothetical protein